LYEIREYFLTGIEPALSRSRLRGNTYFGIPVLRLAGSDPALDYSDLADDALLVTRSTERQAGWAAVGGASRRALIREFGSARAVHHRRRASTNSMAGTQNLRNICQSARRPSSLFERTSIERNDYETPTLNI
jgi:hypothetical protein